VQRIRDRTLILRHNGVCILSFLQILRPADDVFEYSPDHDVQDLDVQVIYRLSIHCCRNRDVHVQRIRNRTLILRHNGAYILSFLQRLHQADDVFEYYPDHDVQDYTLELEVEVRSVSVSPARQGLCFGTLEILSTPYSPADITRSYFNLSHLLSHQNG